MLFRRYLITENFVSQLEPNEDHQHVEHTESALHQATSETSQIESNRSYQLLYQQYIKEKAEMNVREEKLKQHIKKFERDSDNQKKHVRFLNQKLLRQQKSKDALNNLLKELHAENLLDKKTWRIWRYVCFFKFVKNYYYVKFIL